MRQSLAHRRIRRRLVDGRLAAAVLVACIGILAMPSAAHGQVLSKMDFAYGYAIQIDSLGAVQSIVLPARVYESVSHRDLFDVRVFNGQDEEVPVAIERDVDRGVIRTPPLKLPIFPLTAPSGASVDDLDLSVRRSPSGTLIQVRSPGSDGATTATRAYILDASATDDPITSLDLGFDEGTTFLADVRVSTSDELTRWSPWGDPVTLASLRYENDVLRQTKIERAARKVKYIRLAWTTGQGAPPLESAVAEFADRWDEANRSWKEVSPTADPAGTDEVTGFDVYWFDVRGPLPVDRIQPRLPQTNTLARILIQSSRNAEGPWVHRFDGSVYSLVVEGKTIQNPPIAVDRRADRYWRILVDRQGGGIGSQAPNVSFGWVPDRLLFVPRGDGPFVLAVGNANLEGRQPQSSLFRIRLDDRGEVIRPMSSSLGDPIDLGGTTRLTKTREISWEQILLWSVLVVGVLVLATFSLRLLRKTQSEEEQSAA